MNKRVQVLFIALFSFTFLLAQDDHDHAGHDHAEQHDGHDSHDDHGACGMHHSAEFDPGGTAFHHISDQNVFSIGWLQIPLPVIIYDWEEGLDMGWTSSKFHPDAHGNGEYAYNGYILYNGVIKRVVDPSFPSDGAVELGHHKVFYKSEVVDGKAKDKFYVCYNDHLYEAESESTIDGGLLGGGVTSFVDLSPTKNVVTMLLTFLFAFFLFRSIRNAYRNREGQAPAGIQNLFEPVFEFMRDEVMIPFIGPKYEKFLPFIMSLFFGILLLNLIGQVPFFGNPNVTGNLAFTLVLAVFAFLVTNLNGNSHYWGHIFWMPGLPWWVKLIVTPVEILGVILKPVTLALRLFGNITAGHMVLVIFVGLIFVFGKSGENVGAGIGATIGSGLLSLFMMFIELIVAFIQAFVFALLTSSYIGAAVEEHHHEEAHH